MAVSRAKENIGVVGAGTMGTGVAHLFAAAGHQVVLVDSAEAALTRSRELIERNVAVYPMVDAAQPRLDPAEVTGRIVFSANPNDLKNSDFVVENVTEKREIKEALYPQLDSILPPHCVIGVNTSAISITRLAGRTERADRVIGTHIMNPAPLKPLVEVIRGTHTSASTVERTQELFRSAGRESIVVNDAAGFVTNRVMMLTVNEAIFLLHEGVADSAADIDRLFMDCFGHRMGPLATADLIGLDTVLLSLEVIHDSLRDSKYRPCPLLTRLVDAGLHGVKSGRGFFDYA